MCDAQETLLTAAKNLEKVLDEIKKRISDLEIRSELENPKPKTSEIPIPTTGEEEVDVAGQKLLKIGELLTKVANGEKIEKLKKEKKEIAQTFIQLSPIFANLVSFKEAKTIMDMAPNAPANVQERKRLSQRRIPGKEDAEYEYDNESDLVRMHFKEKSKSKSRKFIFFSASRNSYINQTVEVKKSVSPPTVQRPGSNPRQGKRKQRKSTVWNSSNKMSCLFKVINLF